MSNTEDMSMNTHRNTSNEAAVEALLDRRVQARLATDAAYRNAETAEAAAAREDEIDAEVWASYWDRQVG
jgi:hypothetical protein